MHYTIYIIKNPANFYFIIILIFNAFLLHHNTEQLQTKPKKNNIYNNITITKLISFKRFSSELLHKKKAFEL